MIDNKEFRHNHYVPEWYQRRFLPSGQGKYHYLDLKPDTDERNGHRFTRRALQHWGPASCFAQDDLYTVKAGSFLNTEIEHFFFGEIDRNGKAGVEYFGAFAHPDADDRAFQDLMTYMSVQKLRTPKGLGWLAQVAKSQHRSLTLMHLQALQNMFCAIWTECVWQIADATQSPVKFIISDHPVTIYNRGCFPGSVHCVGFNDPDIRQVASHTYFPLSAENILILTNLAWVRNPYQSELKFRPNPNFFRNAMFKYTRIQLHRSLSEQEVLEINYITKRRAFRYIAGAQKEWLYPEERLSSTQWRKFGKGYLLMPEPREIHMGGQIYISYKGGRHDAFGEYGHKAWELGFEDKERMRDESRTLDRFKAEFAVMQGPAWRGTSFEFGRKGPYVDSDEFHQLYVRKACQHRKRGKAHKAT
ncbi:MAG: DUF4238 domain-containing protein [Acetobacteraceae bacterium]